jgi:hypothetical protein
MSLDPVLYMQAEIANLYRREERLSVQDFLSLDEKYGLLHFIAAGYEPFHLMGEQGIISELREFVKNKTPLAPAP